MEKVVGLDPGRLQQAVRAIDDRLSPAVVLLFGTAAAGTMRADSDVDLAVLLGRTTPDPFDLASLRTDLEALLGRGADVVVLDDASPILAMEVLRGHRVLVNRSPELMERFVVRTLGAYFDLKRTRRPIEEALRRSALRA
jgi:predicted nucleotidyltransferase